jgi:hypothetical protein
MKINNNIKKTLNIEDNKKSLKPFLILPRTLYIRLSLNREGWKVKFYPIKEKELNNELQNLKFKESIK